nr:hypothetical protein [Tanacetum cinerariifolium]
MNKVSNAMKNMKKSSQIHRGVPVGHKMGFQQTKQVYRQVSKKNNVSTSANTKKDAEPTKEGFDSGDHDSDYEVASIDNDMANFLASKDIQYCTNSRLEQWKEPYGNEEYDYDPYNDDMYEGQDIPDKIQDICGNLDIKVRGRKKK